MNDRQRKSTSWLDAGRFAFAQSGKRLFGLSMAATLPPSVSAARNDKRADDESEARKEERRETRSEETSRDEKSQDTSGAAKAESETVDDGAKNDSTERKDRSEKQERRDERSDKESSSSGDEEPVEAERRSVARKQQASADDSGGDGDGGREGRRSEDFAQNRNRDDEPDLGDTTDDALPPPTVPSNPNIPVATAPDPTDADLFIEANPDVIASVSTSGGFAFARSGNVIAVTGPDGAQIIQSDDPDAIVTPSPPPDDPAVDGGNNDIDFSS